MATRKIVKIDEEKCNGCGECVPSCAEGAIQIIDGKARLVADNLCDGLGACLGDCPQNAITVEKRDADDFDEVAVKKHLGVFTSLEDLNTAPHHHATGGSCPGSKVINFEQDLLENSSSTQASTLKQWPVQMHLISPTASYFIGADVLLAADCVAFSMGDFHSKHLKGKSLAIACPKLDQGIDIYTHKLVSMIDDAKINTLTVMVMEVPCCGGLTRLAQNAAAKANRKVPIKKLVVSIKGEILNEDWL